MIEWLLKNVLLPGIVWALLLGPLVLMLGLVLSYVVTVATAAAIAVGPILTVFALVGIIGGLGGGNLSPFWRSLLVGGGAGVWLGLIALFALTAWGGVFALPVLGSGVAMLVVSACLWGVLAGVVGASIGAVVVYAGITVCFRPVTNQDEQDVGLVVRTHCQIPSVNKYAQLPAVVLGCNTGFSFWKEGKIRGLAENHTEKGLKDAVAGTGSETYQTRDGINAVASFLSACCGGGSSQ